MDKFLDAFLEEFGQPDELTPVVEADLKKYEGRLPDKLLDYWRQLGFSRFRDGLFWITNPNDYEALLDAWLEDTSILDEDAYHVIARSGFGDLYLWGERSGFRYVMKPSRGLIFAKDGSPGEIGAEGATGPLQRFFASMDADYCDMDGADGQSLFERAVARLGSLQRDELFAFEPALIAGGSATVDTLAKRNVFVHLAILAQFGQKEIMDRKSLTRRAYGA